MKELEQTITVTGSGFIHIVPDVTIIDAYIRCLFDTYDIAYQMAEANLKDIGDIMEEYKLDRKLPKTIDFDIDKKTHSKYDQYHNFIEEVFDGYQLYQHIRINLGMDTVLLANIVRSLGENITHLEITLGYDVKDKRPFELKMVERAVKDATERAKIMALAAGCELGKVHSINYEKKKVDIYMQTRNFSEAKDAACCSPSSLDVTPEDMAAGQDVTVTWYLNQAE